METTVITKSGKKKITIGKTWDRNVCLYCGKELGLDRFNSASFIGALHMKCHMMANQIGRNRTLPNDLKNMKDVDEYFRGRAI